MVFLTVRIRLMKVEIAVCLVIISRLRVVQVLVFNPQKVRRAVAQKATNTTLEAIAVTV